MIDASSARTSLVDRFGPGVSSVEPIGQGDWSRAFAFSLDGRDLVARFGLQREDFEKDRHAARWATPALPIPQVLGIWEAHPGWCCVSERRRGGFLDDLDGPGMRATLPSFWAALDAMRTADLSGTTGFGGWGADGNAAHPSWRAYLADRRDGPSGTRLDGWHEALAGSPTGLGPYEEAAAALDELIPSCPEERHVVHADLLHFNVLVEGARVSAVLDWGCSLYGDFLYDLAWCVMWSPWFSAWADIDWLEEGRRHYAALSVPVPRYAERVRAYCLHIGLDGMRYSAFKGRHDDLAAIAARASSFVRAA